MLMLGIRFQSRFYAIADGSDSMPYSSPQGITETPANMQLYQIRLLSALSSFRPKGREVARSGEIYYKQIFRLVYDSLEMTYVRIN